MSAPDGGAGDLGEARATAARASGSQRSTSRRSASSPVTTTRCSSAIHPRTPRKSRRSAASCSRRRPAQARKEAPQVRREGAGDGLLGEHCGRILGRQREGVDHEVGVAPLEEIERTVTSPRRAAYTPDLSVDAEMPAGSLPTTLPAGTLRRRSFLQGRRRLKRPQAPAGFRVANKGGGSSGGPDHSICRRVLRRIDRLCCERGDSHLARFGGRGCGGGAPPGLTSVHGARHETPEQKGDVITVLDSNGCGGADGRRVSHGRGTSSC